jgi:hypothetical protein
MQDGHYKFTFEYSIDDQINSCSFDVRLTTKKSTSVIWFWEYLETMHGRHYGPGG